MNSQNLLWGEKATDFIFKAALEFIDVGQNGVDSKSYLHRADSSCGSQLMYLMLKP